MAGKKKKTALVLAGGGIMGAAYEIGCLAALDRVFSPGFSTRHFDSYVGISAGSVIATLIANRISPRELYRVILNDERTVFNWRRKDIYRLDVGETARAVRGFIKNLYRIFKHHRSNKWGSTASDMLLILQEQLPTGLFSLNPMQEYLNRSFAEEGLPDDFNQLKTELYIPAYDLDLGERVIFGLGDEKGTSICDAITASCAIPFFFQPYQIEDRSFIDGSYGRVSHLDIPLEQGADLVLVINPRTPMRNDRESHCLPSMSFGHCSSIKDLGFSLVWEQSQRIGNREDMEVSLELYRQKYPKADIVLIEPAREESLLFLQGPMNQGARSQVMQHGFELTLSHLRENFSQYESIFKKHGIRTTDAFLSNKDALL